ncbi:MAG TPA: hypothetical protein VKD67_13220, partial [Acidimicrobiales bacterium]|nr:hypothetical protein [Acidimicrobiales bacterium]
PVGGTVGGAAAFAGQAVAALDVITSDPNGKIRFDLGNALPFCQVETDSEVQAAPGGAALVAVNKGTVLCRTSSAGQLKTFNAGGSVLQAVDPVFLLGWDGSEVRLRVAQGYVGVRGPQGTVPIGANRQTSFSPNDQPGVGPWDQSELRGELRDTVNRQVSTAVQQARPPGYPAVGTNGSPSLAAAVQRGELRVLVTANGNDQAVALTEGLLKAFLQHAPKVGLSVQEASQNEASTALNAGRVDLLVSASLRTRTSRALFSLDGDTWFVTQSGNGGNLLDNLAAFLTTALQARCSGNRNVQTANPGQSCYEATYRDAIGAGNNEYVPLDGLAPYLGLG